MRIGCNFRAIEALGGMARKGRTKRECKEQADEDGSAGVGRRRGEAKAEKTKQVDGGVGRMGTAMQMAQAV